MNLSRIDSHSNPDKCLLHEVSSLKKCRMSQRHLLHDQFSLAGTVQATVLRFLQYDVLSIGVYRAISFGIHRVVAINKQ